MASLRQGDGELAELASFLISLLLDLVYDWIDTREELLEHVDIWRLGSI
jgi:hypothetical protein